MPQLCIEYFDAHLEHTMCPSEPQQWVFYDRFPAALYEIKNKHSGEAYRGYTKVKWNKEDQEGGKVHKSTATKAIQARAHKQLVWVLPY